MSGEPKTERAVLDALWQEHLFRARQLALLEADETASYEAVAWAKDHAQRAWRAVVDFEIELTRGADAKVAL